FLSFTRLNFQQPFARLRLSPSARSPFNQWFSRRWSGFVDNGWLGAYCPQRGGAVAIWTGTVESVWASGNRASARPGLPLPRTVSPPLRSTCPALRQQDGGSDGFWKTLRS